MGELSNTVFKKARSSTQPRWHSQSYMVFLALRQHPEHCLPRNELLHAAVNLDKKISGELGLPRVFKGKTPCNSASAILTNNSDRYFIGFKPEGSRSMHFKLAYEPGDPNTAIKEYHKWNKKLAEHDWPYCFGIPKPLPPTAAVAATVARCLLYKPPLLFSSSTASTSPSLSSSASTSSPSDSSTTTSLHSSCITFIEPMKVDSSAIKQQEEPVPPSAAMTTTTPGSVLTLDQLDLTHVPTNIDDIVYVAPSAIANAGSGLFAKRHLPCDIPIGFYFGVPMTEDEYDSLKDRIGRASEYSIMYRKTVLDATDESGQPVTDPQSEFYCPFHFMNETDERQANILFVEGSVVNQVICWTKKDIQPGEELLVWYGKDVNRYWDKKKDVL
ncbi:hypothetical protein K501DRAFT_178546 [Backusella circina FSU 941]|nr:hypothetical protein K501DRAFT_178546 [Backusella circina FSU 941]